MTGRKVGRSTKSRGDAEHRDRLRDAVGRTLYESMCVLEPEFDDRNWSSLAEREREFFRLSLLKVMELRSMEMLSLLACDDVIGGSAN